MVEHELHQNRLAGTDWQTLRRDRMILDFLEWLAGALYDFIFEPEPEPLDFEKSGGRWFMGVYTYG
jgi:hypothetical protein